MSPVATRIACSERHTMIRKKILQARLSAALATAGLLASSGAAVGKESKWVQTVPGKGWNTILRLYGPLEPWFNKTWRPGEIEPLM